MPLDYNIVTCHPAAVTFFALTPAKLVLEFATPERCKAEWTSWLVTYGDGIPARRQSPIPVVTGPDVW